MLVGGISFGSTAASCAYRSSLDCRREGSVVVCELRRIYPGAVASADRFQLNSAWVKTVSYWLKGPRSYGLLVLNSELEVPSTFTDPRDLAARLNELLAGKATVTGTIPLREPSYGDAIFLSAIAALLSGIGALLLWLSVGGKRSTPSSD
jgi:hypothetical protein